MENKILIATHKKYSMPKDSCYIPIHVGRTNSVDMGYIGDNTGDNISLKNPNYCELTALYWGWKNVKCDYLGLAHYRRHFSNKSIIYRIFNKKDKSILSEEELNKLVMNYDVILPNKRRYYIETIYTHYAHTHYAEHLDITRDIILNNCPEYIDAFDKVMNKRSAHMFNMVIMKKEILDEYCNWLFYILGILEKEIDISTYDAFQARLFGRVSEILLNVWLEKKQLNCKTISHIHLEKINWINKIYLFLKAKFSGQKFNKSF